MKTTLLISTYNSPKYLKLCLRSILRQTLQPYEIVIADDGSTGETKNLIDTFRKSFKCTIKHVWQEDLGFRKSKIWNKALAHCAGEYIIQIDGDVIAERHFIEDHLHFAKPGYFYGGGRCLLTERVTKEVLDEGEIEISFFRKGLKHRFNVLRFKLLTPLFFFEKHSRGCNMAFWKKDVYAINGYDERMEGCGSEDTDFDERLMRSGIKRRHIKLSAVVYHLFHGSKIPSTINDSLIEENRKNKATWLPNGINQYLKQSSNDDKYFF